MPELVIRKRSRLGLFAEAIREKQKATILSFGFALLMVVLATYLRVRLGALIEERLPFGFYTLAVMIVAWLCGPRLACFALVMSTISSAHFVIEPAGSLWISNPADQVALGLFFVVGTISISLFAYLDRQRKQAIEQVEVNQALNDQLKAIDQRKDEFLALLAHELRGPMAPLGNAIRLVERSSGDRSMVHENLKAISRNFNHLTRLVNDLLDVSRFMRDNIVLQFETIDIRECLERAHEMVQGEMDKKSHELRIEAPRRPILLSIDSIRICQVLCNLLVNAARYTPPGGLIRVNVVEGSKGVEISVSDNGLGLTQDQIEKIFLPFHQVNSKKSRYGAGLGIGLSIVRKLVELHGGMIDVESPGLNLGSRFAFTLPSHLRRIEAEPTKAASSLVANFRVEHENSTNKEEEQMEFEAGGQYCDSTSSSCSTAQLIDKHCAVQSVLIVDDDRDTAETMKALLSLEGFDCTVANNGMDAIAACQSLRPDLVILDIGLPDLDGYETARRIRKQSLSHMPRIIAVSGWGAEQDREQSLQAGFDAHFVKPVPLASLIEYLSNAKSC